MFMRPMPMELIEINWDGEKLTLADGVSWEGRKRCRSIRITGNKRIGETFPLPAEA
jgi:hypothetical protein